ncbi:MAG: ubiquinol-cytochrome c reductase iron-sulfur subunit [Acidimicrobiia bacterium]
MSTEDRDRVWREDFPYTSEGEDDVTRREFVRYLVLASGAFAVGGVGVAAWASLRHVNEGEPRPIVALDDVAEGGAYLFRYPTEADPAILLRLDAERVVAFSQKCTHLGCVVYWDERHDELVCPCHEGIFDPDTGAVVAGPPQRPLAPIAVEIRPGGEVWALGGGAT